MARRRMPTDSDLDSAFDPSAPSGGMGPGGDDALQRRIQADMDAGMFDNPIAGNPDSARDLFSSPGPRTMAPAAPAAPTVQMDEDGITPRRGPIGGAPSASPSLDQIMAMLPQGVEAGGASQAENAPMLPSAPEAQSVSMKATPPAGPRRQQISSPRQFGSKAGGGLLGNAGGLMGGGVGMPGGPSGGPKATEEMLALLKSLGL